MLHKSIFTFISGIANIFGKLFTGWFSDITWVDSFVVANVYMFMCGLSVILLPTCNTYIPLAVVASMYGIFSAFVILRTIVLVELLGLDKLTSAFGVLALFEGTGELHAKYALTHFNSMFYKIMVIYQFTVYLKVNSQLNQSEPDS